MHWVFQGQRSFLTVVWFIQVHLCAFPEDKIYLGQACSGPVQGASCVPGMQFTLFQLLTHLLL